MVLAEYDLGRPITIRSGREKDVCGPARYRIVHIKKQA
jgi:hypothetical protein